jgi:signal recognition particle subunit SEC65
MNKEVLFFKYLDSELGDDGARQVEKLIRENPEVNKVFEKVKEKRLLALDFLESLNPEEEVIVPQFKIIQEAKKRTFIMPIVWRYAAAVAFVIALSLSFWLFDIDETVEIASNQNEITTEIEPTYDTYELDEYISPNRCWNQRQLLWTVIELND